jgi:Clostripain family
MKPHALDPHALDPHALNPPAPVPWTVMVFMAADANLEPHAAIDLAEMAKVDVRDKVHGRDKVKVVVQIVRSSRRPERFLIQKGHCVACPGVSPSKAKNHHAMPGAGRTHETLRASSRNTGRPEVLTDFLEWAHENHPAEHYLLILWGHFIGVGFAPRDNDALLLSELAGVLAGFKQRTGRNLDILGGDTCSMAFAEAAYELKDSVDYMVASELPVQFQGWKYDEVLNAIVNHPGTISPLEFGQAIVNSYIDSYKPPSVSMTMLNLKEAEGLSKVFTGLVQAVKKAPSEDLLKILPAFEGTAHAKIRSLIDLRDLCTQLENATKSKALQEAAQAGIRALEERKNGDGFIVLNRHSNLEIRNMHGLGVFAPCVTDRRDWYLQRIKRNVYNALGLARDSHWGKLVFNLFELRNSQPSN